MQTMDDKDLLALSRKYERLTFEWGLCRSRHDDVKIAQIVIMRFCVDAGHGLRQELLRLFDDSF